MSSLAKTLACGLCLVLGLLVPALATATPALADEGIHLVVSGLDASAFPDIHLVVSVTGANGKPVRGLGGADLKVIENGVTQNATTALASEVAPVALAMVLDTSGSMAGRPLANAKTAMNTLAATLNGLDQGAVVTFAASVQVRQTLTSDAEGLIAATNAAVAGGDTAIYDALAAASDVLASAPARSRRAIVLLTDGVDNSSRAERAGVLAALGATKTPVIVIGLGADLDRPALRAIAAAAPGGQFIEAPRPTDLAAIYAGLSEQLLSQYSVSYRSSAAAGADAPMVIELTLQRAGVSAATASLTYRVPAPRGAAAPTAAPLDPAPVSAPTIDGPSQRARMSELIGLLGAATVLTLLLWIAELANSFPGRQRRRLEVFVRSLSLTSSSHTKRRSIVQRVLVPSLRVAGRPIMRITPVGVLASTKERLQHAGEPLSLAPVEFIGIRVGLALALATVGLAVATQITGEAGAAPNGLLAGALLGFAIPGFVVDAVGRSRKTAIRRALPAALDMLALSAEAGLSFDGAISQVAHRWDTPLSDEFRRLLVEFQMGRERRHALRELAQRTGVAELVRFANAVAQADSLGVPLSRVLHEQSTQIRIQRRQRAEELARKAPVKMLFPMVALIFPALFVVILGPAVPRLLQSLGSLP